VTVVLGSWLHIRRRVGGELFKTSLNGLASLAKLHPESRTLLQSVEVDKDVAYTKSGLVEHRLDVYRSKTHSGPRPVVFYVHGGAFRILSKDTHWMMAAHFALAGYTVFTINYRLAPASPFPAALEDVGEAARWILQNGSDYGADNASWAVAGESAGANLILALVAACSFELEEPYARKMFELNLPIKAALPACGVLQVSDIERLWHGYPRLAKIIQDRLLVMAEDYLGVGDHAPRLADPLLMFEEDLPVARALPPMGISVGERDLLLEDSRRLAQALLRRNVNHRLWTYPGGIHAFHAMHWSGLARKCWRDQLDFLSTCMAL
jgi:acetyl esterase